MLLRFMHLGGWRSHRALLSIALPMILANVTTPLVGLVDTAVLGHLHSPDFLAGASVSALIITQLIWICGFLRMSTTGRSAQAFGTQRDAHKQKVLYQSLALALFISVLILPFHRLILHLGTEVADLQGIANQAAHDYFTVRIISLPAALFNLVLVGWLVGQQATKAVLIIQVVGNLFNAGLNLILVLGFQLGVKGVATATLCAEYGMCIAYLVICVSRLGPSQFSKAWFSQTALIKVLSVNSDLLLRNLILQACIAFVTLQGARYGVIQASINAVIMQFFALIALGLDGIAYAVEAKVGEAKGRRSSARLSQACAQGMLWSNIVAWVYAGIFWVCWAPLAQLFTTHDSVLVELTDYQWIIIGLPLVGHWCFLFDGVAVGLSRSKAMRNTMLLSAVAVFLPVWWLTQNLGNHSVWFAMLAFLAARGISLGIDFRMGYQGLLSEPDLT